jgi:hypothetical protein
LASSNRIVSSFSSPAMAAVLITIATAMEAMGSHEAEHLDLVPALECAHVPTAEQRHQLISDRVA